MCIRACVCMCARACMCVCACLRACVYHMYVELDVNACHACHHAHTVSAVWQRGLGPAVHMCVMCSERQVLHTHVHRCLSKYLEIMRDTPPCITQYMSMQYKYMCVCMYAELHSPTHIHTICKTPIHHLPNGNRPITCTYIVT